MKKNTTGYISDVPVITSIHYTAEWDTAPTTKYWHEMIVCATEWREEGCYNVQVLGQTLNTFLLIITDDTTHIN